MADAGGVSEHALVLRVTRAVGLSQDLWVHPSVATQMVKVHLVVVADFFFVVTVRVAAEDDEVVPKDVSRVEGSFPRDKFFPEVFPGIVDFGPVAIVELKGEHSVR